MWAHIEERQRMKLTKYVRRRKQDRPRCSICGRGYRAGSTRGMVTYYYPDCDCPCENKKKMRSRKPGN